MFIIEPAIWLISLETQYLKYSTPANEIVLLYYRRTIYSFCVCVCVCYFVYKNSESEIQYSISVTILSHAQWTFFSFQSSDP